jgi:hypothetical protein
MKRKNILKIFESEKNKQKIKLKRKFSCFYSYKAKISKIFYGFLKVQVLKKSMLSRSRKEPLLLVGAGALPRCGTGSDGSGSDNGIKHGWELKIGTKCNVHIFSNKNRTESYEQDSLNMSLNFCSFQKFFLAIKKSRSRSR